MFRKTALRWHRRWRHLSAVLCRRQLQLSCIRSTGAGRAAYHPPSWYRLPRNDQPQAADAGHVLSYARNEQLGLIPYDYVGVGHVYTPDYLVKLADGRTLILEIKGHQTDQENAKHAAAKRWVSAVNHWGQLGRWAFHVNRDPQMLAHELRHLTQTHPAPAAAD